MTAIQKRKQKQKNNKKATFVHITFDSGMHGQKNWMAGDGI